MAIIIAGVVLDNYKLERYKKELEKNNFKIISTKPFTQDSSTIKVEVDNSRVPELNKLLRLLEATKNQN